MSSKSSEFSSTSWESASNIDEIRSIITNCSSGIENSILNTPWKEYISILKILVVFSCPSNTNPLRLQTEEKAIREALFQTISHRHDSHGMTSDNISIKFLPACTIDDLRCHLLHDEYHLIHFSGHADRTSLISNHIYDQLHASYQSTLTKSDIIKDLNVQARVNLIAEQLIEQYERQINELQYSDISIPVNIQIDYQSKSMSYPIILQYEHAYSHIELVNIGIGSLAFESNTGHASFVPPSAFASLLSHHKSLQCVIMNACSSFIQGHFILPHVPLIICHQGQIADQESIAFSQGFYNSLRLGSINFETCYKHGVCNVDLKRMLPGMPKRHNISSYFEVIILQTNDVLSLERYHSLHHQYRSKLESTTMKPPIEAPIPADKIDISTNDVENTKLRMLVSYGMQLLQSKDQELETARSMIRLLANDCDNLDTVQLARSLFSAKSSTAPRGGVDVQSALLSISSLFQTNHLQQVSSSHDTSSRIEVLNGKQSKSKQGSGSQTNPPSLSRRSSSSSRSSSTSSSSTLSRKNGFDQTPTKRSAGVRAKYKSVHINYSKSRQSAVTIACLKPTEPAVKIAFGYRDHDNQEKKAIITPKKASTFSISDSNGHEKNRSPHRKSMSMIPHSPRNSANNKSLSVASKEEPNFPIADDITSSMMKVPPMIRPAVGSPTSVADIVDHVYVDENTAMNLNSEIDSSAKDQSGKLMTVYNQTNAASKAFRQFLKEKRSAISAKTNAS